MAPAEPWRLLVLTPVRIGQLWAQLHEFPDALRLMGIDSERRFLDVLSSDRSVFYDIGAGSALLAALDVEPGHDARVVFVGFDHRVQQHASAFAGALRDLAALAQLRRVTAYIPASLPVLVKLVTRKLGFAWEGCLTDGWSPGTDLHVNGWCAASPLPPIAPPSLHS